jgi:hypothetical protein
MKNRERDFMFEYVRRVVEKEPSTVELLGGMGTDHDVFIVV